MKLIGMLFVMAVVATVAALAWSAESQPGSDPQVRWEYAVLGRAPASEQLQFETSEAQFQAATIGELRQKIGGKKEGNLMNLLSVIGAKGWELVAVGPDELRNGSFPQFYFKRPAR